jgi:hypothetical protein
LSEELHRSNTVVDVPGQHQYIGPRGVKPRHPEGIGKLSMKEL